MNEKKDYSKTVNLPKTNFRMRGNLSQRELFFVEEWEKGELYNKLCEKNKNKKKFIFHDGPPYANAHIHIGTGLNKVLKDFVMKYRSMSGNYVPFTPGWDCHGLPIEQIVLKNMKTDKNKVNRLIFRKQAADFAKRFVEVQKVEFKRLGIIADWDHPYLTLDKKYESSIVKVFGDLVKNGFIYRRKRPVYWCPTCETAMADAEVEYVANHESDSVFVKFQIISLSGAFKVKEQLLKSFSVLIWTTTPWTLPANVALAFDNKSEYVAVIYNFENGRKEKLLVAKALVENVKDKIKAEDFDIILEARGVDFVNMKCQNPLVLNKQSYGIIAEFVSVEDGTGIVHIAPGHGLDDYQVSLKYGLEIVSYVNAKGLFTKEVSEFEDINIFTANNMIIEKLVQEGKILTKLKLMHSYPYCWRCKKPIIFRATSQWFMSMEHNGLRRKLLDFVKNICWIPKYGENRIALMMESRPDWCLSRQRLWGVPIPVFYCKNCGKFLLDDKIISRISDLFSEKGSDSWFEMTEEELLQGLDVKCFFCNSINFRKGEDILDVWFDSGVSYEAVLVSNKYKDLEFPADLYLEGSDQHRGWFQASMIPAVAVRGTPPYKNVLTHGFVVDGCGKKMSKSVGNVISSEQLINKYGADIIRFWIASSDYKEDIRISDEIIKGLSDSYRRIRNTIRFLLGNVRDFEPKNILLFKNMQEIDKYALSCLQKVVSTVIDAYENYEFHKVVKAINNFCAVFLSGFYLDILKDTLYCDAKYSNNKISAQSAIFEICSVVVRLISPILSFTAEEAWKEIKELFPDLDLSRSVFLAEFPVINNKYILQTEVLDGWRDMLYVRKKVLVIYEKLRKDKIIGSDLEASLNIVYGQKYSKFFKDPKLVNLILGTWDVKCNVSNDENTLIINASKSEYEKCARCWRHINGIKDDLCPRCAKVVK
ncbi:MAG: isoleucine--tRNA ligase [Endomicrobium sp.]|jgi:isoleucyl-tRNA synthetase|nr:isoleucine--tRNA ligase [Endomicrobium sp.]